MYLSCTENVSAPYETVYHGEKWRKKGHNMCFFIGENGPYPWFLPTLCTCSKVIIKSWCDQSLSSSLQFVGIPLLATMHDLLSNLSAESLAFQIHASLSLDDNTQINSTSPVLTPRDRQSSPDTSGPGSFHVSQLVDLEGQFYAAALDAMSVWIYSRTQKEVVNRHLSSDRASRAFNTPSESRRT